MLDTYRKMLADWQSLQQQLWAANPWLTSFNTDDVYSVVNPWTKACIEQSMALQSAWFKKWQEAAGMTAQLPSMYVGSFQQANKSWAAAQQQLWNTWTGMVVDTAARPAARATPSEPRVRRGTAPRSATPPAAAPAQLKLDARDDLKQISGIGPGLEKKLNDQGIISFRQIADLSKIDIARLEQTVIKFPGRIQRENWIGQAKKLAQA